MKTNPTEREIALIEEFLTNLDDKIEVKVHELSIKEFKYKSHVKKYEAKISELEFFYTELAAFNKMLKDLSVTSERFELLREEASTLKYKAYTLSTNMTSDFSRCELSLALDVAILKAIHETMVRFAKDWRDILGKAKPKSKEPVS